MRVTVDGEDGLKLAADQLLAHALKSLNLLKLPSDSGPESKSIVYRGKVNFSQRFRAKLRTLEPSKLFRYRKDGTVDGEDGQKLAANELLAHALSRGFEVQGWG